MSLQTIHQNAYGENAYVKEFGINIDTKLAPVEARVLPAPWVNFNITLISNVATQLHIETLSKFAFYPQLSDS